MSRTPTFTPARTALLVMDFQNFILQNFLPAGAAEPTVTNAARALEAARDAGMMVIHINVGFRPGYPEVSSSNRMFAMVRDNHMADAHSPATHITKELTPLENEPVIHKHRISAFFSTDLEMILRAGGIDTLILAGVATSNVVLSTFLDGFDRDYQLAVLHDACADANIATHAHLTETFFPTLGHVLSTGELEAALHGTPSGN